MLKLSPTGPYPPNKGMPLSFPFPLPQAFLLAANLWSSPTLATKMMVLD